MAASNHASQHSRSSNTPPPPNSAAGGMSQDHGLGFAASFPPTITTDHDYDIVQGINDSPTRTLDYGRTDPMGSMLSPTSASFPAFAGMATPSGSLYTPQTANSYDGTFQPFVGQEGQQQQPQPQPQQQQQQQPLRNPFNFTPVHYTASKSTTGRGGEALGKRKGHKYRHSSVHASAMDSIIQPPVQRTPLAVPAALPIPTRKEAWRSLTPNQTIRLAWCLCHFLVAGYVQFSSEGSLAMMALSRLLLFDAAGATACVAVDVMGNFEVWKRSSIKHPFGLERADVLAGFGMAVFIAFMGLDVISHSIEHSLENVGAHEPHTSHAHGRVAGGQVDIASLLAIGSTLVSALLLKNHARIGKATRLTLIAGGGRVLGNPSHVLTISCSVLLLVLPWLELHTYALFDLAFALLTAILMVAFGLRLGSSLASILLMSYRTSTADRRAVREVINDIETDPDVSSIDEARFWQVHYGLCVANLKLRHRSADSDLKRIRQRISTMIRSRLGGQWEISMQMTADGD